VRMGRRCFLLFLRFMVDCEGVRGKRGEGKAVYPTLKISCIPK